MGCAVAEGRTPVAEMGFGLLDDFVQGNVAHNDKGGLGRDVGALEQVLKVLAAQLGG